MSKYLENNWKEYLEKCAKIWRSKKELNFSSRLEVLKIFVYVSFIKTWLKIT